MGMPMIGSQAALEYAELYIPDMLPPLDQEAAEYYDCFVERLRYLVRKDRGTRPKFHKGRCGRKYDYWTCGNCGATVKREILEKYCCNCGYAILWDSTRCLTK